LLNSLSVFSTRVKNSTFQGQPQYDLKNLQEFMNDRAIPMQTLQMDFVKALAMCRQAG